MRKLENILQEVELLEISGATDREVRGIAFDSRKVVPGDLFVALRGTQTDGHRFISRAVDSGAAAVLCEELPADRKPAVTYVVTGDTAHGLGIASRNFYGDPSGELTLVGVTGTNGKTTIVTLLHQLFMEGGYASGLISTIENRVGDQAVPATLTTPDAPGLQKLMRQMVDQGCQYCFMEVSSHAIVQKRISGLSFDAALFTNITHDHLDYHASFSEYILAKKQFFDQLSEQAFALVNNDDRNSRVMVQNCRAEVASYAVRSMADFSCRILEQHLDGTLITINNRELWTPLIGEFNAYNLLAAYGCAMKLGFPEEQLPGLLSKLRPVRGRLETILTGKGTFAVVDYAHTPDALNKAIQAIKKCMGRKASLITVLGAGGNRDKQKRPRMAEIAAEQSARVILTSDNPRDEEPEQIIAEMMTGIQPAVKNRVVSISNRREAIKAALLLAGENDVVLVAGKGHETYQETKGARIHFDDREEIIKYGAS